MDFGAILSAAKKNNSKQTVACYQTKFTPPKKENRQSKILSQNIKKFLAKKEEEEKQKAIEEKVKKQNLLALRDHKAQSRISKHLKVCKAANKSVLEDAIDTENTAITAAGPSQPDEDDYGYVSQEASAFYNKLMNKYNSMPAEKSIFSASGKKTVKDIASTKDRVKQALKQQEIEESQGCRKKRKLTNNIKNPEENSKTESTLDEKASSENTCKPDKLKTKSKLMPPPIDFVQLLKLAEKKQHEPVVIEVKPKVEEPERLMTKKQMKEYAKIKECREAKLEKNRAPENSTTDSTSIVEINKSDKPNGLKSEEFSNTKKVFAVKHSIPTASPHTISKKSSARSIDRHTDNSKNVQQKDKDDFSKERRKLEMERRKLEELRRNIKEERRKLNSIKEKQVEEQKRVNGQINKASNKNAFKSGHEIDRVNSNKQLTGISSNSKKPGHFAMENTKNLKDKKMLAKNKKNILLKRQAEHDDYDDYDSELDDFIDNDDEDGNEDYSKYISEIFGYDKNKYKYNYDDDDDDDDRAMESNFAQQLKEEFVSTKIGIMEDLEDIRKEAKEKKRKALIKRKKCI